MQQSALLDQSLHIHVAEAHPLHEMAEKVDQAKGCQEVFHMLDPRVPKAADARIQVPYNEGIPPHKSVQFPLKIWKMIRNVKG